MGTWQNMNECWSIAYSLQHASLLQAINIKKLLTRNPSVIEYYGSDLESNWAM